MKVTKCNDGFYDKNNEHGIEKNIKPFTLKYIPVRHYLLVGNGLVRDVPALDGRLDYMSSLGPFQFYFSVTLG